MGRWSVGHSPADSIDGQLALVLANCLVAKIRFVKLYRCQVFLVNRGENGLTGAVENGIQAHPSRVRQSGIFEYLQQNGRLHSVVTEM